MDLAETMKNIVVKNMQTDMGPPGGGSGYASSASGAGYVTEKMYMLLQLYLQNKGWNPSIELLQCFSELKEASMLPSAAYLQMMASRVALDSQGRLILRENGKIILPYEHFANAVMLKHMHGPPGLHLSLEGTIRAVMESYTIGRECFGMEKEFIIEVVQNCPNPACRYYKNQLELTQKMGHMTPTYIQDNDPTSSMLRFSHNNDYQSNINHSNQNSHMASIISSSGSSSDMTDLRGNQINIQRPPSRPALNIPHRPSSQDKKNIIKQQQQHHQQQQHQQQQQQQQHQQHQQQQQQQHYETIHSSNQIPDHKLTDFLRTNLDNLEGLSGIGLGNLQGLTNANKDLLALHNGAWTIDEKGIRQSTSNVDNGGGKIVRAFAEVMKNMARMKACVRPAMCKPYGKQSEALQKTLVDTIQLVQSLRSFLPPPHIPVSSWKNEDKQHRLDHTTVNYLPTLKTSVLEDLCESRKID